MITCSGDAVLHRRGRRAGERRCARQLLFAVAFVAGLATHVVAADTDAERSRVMVRETDGVYLVEATFDVRQPAAVALAVLTDYEAIPRFMPDVRASRVLERGEGRALVEQEAVSKVMMFSKRVHLVLDIVEEPGTIRFRDRCGKSFQSYEGTWRIFPHNGYVSIAYSLAAKPAFDVPDFMLKRLLRRDANRMIEALQREIAERSTASIPPLLRDVD